MNRRRTSVNHEVMHEINRALILSSLHKYPSQTRAKLSLRSGLTRSAVSNLADELIQNGMIHEVGYEESTGGRRGILLELNPDGACVIAVKLSPAAIQCALVNLVGEIDWYRSLPIDSTEQSYVVGQSVQLIQSALALNNGARPVLGIGVASPGLISAEGGIIYSKYMDWHNVDFHADWEERFGAPVSIDNEVRLSALGESRYGSATDDSHFVYMEVGHGVGAGIVIDGQLYHGKHGFAGEVGFMASFMDAENQPASLHWQDAVNIPYLLETVAQMQRERNGRFTRAAHFSFERVVELIRADDGLACAAMRKIGRRFAIGLANLYHAFDIPVFILGGELGREYGPFLPEIRAEVERRLASAPPGGIDLRISSLQPNASLMGAVARVFDMVLVEPSLSWRL